jgi:hypothetical protein
MSFNNTKKTKYVSANHVPWGSRGLSPILTWCIFVLVLGVSVGDSTLQAAARNVGEQIDPAVVQGVGQSAARKGMIWRAEDKWATADGYNWAGIESDLQDMQNAGAKWVRIAFWQNQSLSYYDRLLPLIGQYGLQVLGNVRKTDPSKDLGTTAQQAAYRTWLSNVVTRYQGNVRYWEIENETNIPSGWNICLDTSCQNSDAAAYSKAVGNYVQVLKIAHETIKAVDPSLQVLIAGLCECGAERYLDELIRLDAQRYFDIMAYHPFGRAPDQVIERLNALKAKMALQPALALKPIWITAIGYQTANWNGTPGRVANEQVKADYLLQTMELLSEANGVAGPIFWYILSEPIAKVNGFGLIYKDASQQPLKTVYLPAYTAYKELWTTKYVAILPAIEDSFVSKNSPTGRYTTSQQLKIGYGSDVRQAYMKFDLASLAGHRLLQTQLRFITANVAGAGSAATQSIALLFGTGWSEATLTYRNQPAPIIGTVSNTAQGTGYQVWLDEAALQQAVGGKATLMMQSTSADELIIQSREWKKSLRLVVYYSPAAAATTANELEAPSAEELEAIEPLTADGSALRIEEPYNWSGTSDVSGAQELCSYERPDCPEQRSGPPLYLPYMSR